MPRPRKPTKLKELSGSYKTHKNRRPENEPQPKGEIGSPPESSASKDRKEEIAAIWVEMKAVIADGVMTDMDRPALELLCNTLYEIRHAEKFSSAMYQTAVSLLSRFGMTPADRSRVNTGSKPEGNKFEKKEYN